MKKQLFAAIAAAIATAVAAQEPPAPQNEPMMPPPDMAAPECPMGKAVVGAPEMEGGMVLMMPPPEGRGMMAMPGAEAWKRDAAERGQRRSEIMILMQAYKIMPEEGRAAIKAELEKRIREDYLSHRKRAEQMIAKMEERIAKMKAELSDEKTDEMVKREFDKLMNLPPMPPAGMRPEMRNEKNGGQPPRMMQQRNRDDRRGNAPERDGRKNPNRKEMNSQKRPPAPDAGAFSAPDGEPVPPPAPEEME